jgi:hypothetical protein
MPLRDKLRIDDRFSWAFTGVLVAVVFGIVGLYATLRENRPNLVVEIENQADVLDVHRPLEDLKLSFRGQDIQQQNLNLRIFTIRVANLRVPSSSPSVSLIFRDLQGPVTALPCAQGVAQQFLNFLPLPQGQ